MDTRSRGCTGSLGSIIAGGAVAVGVAVTSGINLCRVGVGATVAAGAGACVAAGAGRCVAAGAGGCVAAGAGGCVGAIVGAGVGAGAAGAAVAAGVGVASSSSSPPHATITSKSPPIKASIASTFQVACRHPLLISTPNLCFFRVMHAQKRSLHLIGRVYVCQHTKNVMRQIVATSNKRHLTRRIAPLNSIFITALHSHG